MEEDIQEQASCSGQCEKASVRKAPEGGVCLGMTLPACGGQTKGRGLQCGPLTPQYLNVVILRLIIQCTWENSITKTFFFIKLHSKLLHSPCSIECPLTLRNLYSLAIDCLVFSDRP